jgi:hypothetical protein
LVKVEIKADELAVFAAMLPLQLHLTLLKETATVKAVDDVTVADATVVLVVVKEEEAAEAEMEETETAETETVGAA